MPDCRWFHSMISGRSFPFEFSSFFLISGSSFILNWFITLHLFIWFFLLVPFWEEQYVYINTGKQNKTNKQTNKKKQPKNPNPTTKNKQTPPKQTNKKSQQPITEFWQCFGIIYTVSGARNGSYNIWTVYMISSISTFIIRTANADMIQIYRIYYQTSLQLSVHVYYYYYYYIMYHGKRVDYFIPLWPCMTSKAIGNGTCISLTVTITVQVRKNSGHKYLSTRQHFRFISLSKSPVRLPYSRSNNSRVTLTLNIYESQKKKKKKKKKKRGGGGGWGRGGTVTNTQRNK